MHYGGKCRAILVDIRQRSRGGGGNVRWSFSSFLVDISFRLSMITIYPIFYIIIFFFHPLVSIHPSRFSHRRPSSPYSSSHATVSALYPSPPPRALRPYPELVDSGYKILRTGWQMRLFPLLWLDLLVFWRVSFDTTLSVHVPRFSIDWRCEMW